MDHVKLNGVRVPLEVLRNYLQDRKGYTLQDLADLTASFGGPIDPATVSRSIRGKTPFNTKLRRALETRWDADDWSDVVSQYTGSDPASDPAPDDDDDGDDAETDDDDDADDAFPIEAALNVAETVRNARRNDNIGATFSPRQFQDWTFLHAAMRAEGWNADDALGASYCLVSAHKNEGADRELCENAFRAEFGYAPKVPDPDLSATSSPTAHPNEKLVELCLRAGLNVFLHGDTGTSKNWTVEGILKRNGVPFTKVQGGDKKLPEDVIAGPALTVEDGASKTETQYAAIAQAVRDGRPIILDEIGRFDPGVINELMGLANGDGLDIPQTGETLHPGPGFFIVATNNDAGTGRGGRFGNLANIGDALRNRFAFVNFDYLPRERERKLVQRFAERAEARAAKLAAGDDAFSHHNGDPAETAETGAQTDDGETTDARLTSDDADGETGAQTATETDDAPTWIDL